MTLSALGQSLPGRDGEKEALGVFPGSPVRAGAAASLT